MLADMLLVDLVSRGYNPVVVSTELTEAERLFDTTPQVFYYDDFLGQTSFSEKLGKNEDARLAQFIAELRQHDNKRLILTTREYILRQAQSTYEPLARLDMNLVKCVVDLGDYTRSVRARILFNHLYFSDLTADLKTALLTDHKYRAVIEHPNYNPRLIETITEFASRQDMDARAFVAFMFDTLENPTRIWDHAFRYQLDRTAQLVLLALVSLPSETGLDDVQVCVESLAANDGTGNVGRLFHQALRTLEGTFIHIERPRWRQGERLLSFSNPSVRDFLLAYLRQEQAELRLLTASCVYFEQVDRLWRYGEVGSRSSAASVLPTHSMATDGTWKVLGTLRSCFDTSLEMERHVPTGSNSYWIKWTSASAEDRLATALAVLDVVSTAEALRWCENELQNRADSWLNHDSNKYEAIRLLATSAGVSIPQLATQISVLRAAARDWFITTLDRASEFAAFHDLNRAVPDLFAKEQVRDALQLFQEFTTSLLDTLQDEEPDDLASDLEVLESAARGFGLYGDSTLREIRQYVQDREEEPDEDESRYDSNPDVDDDDDIDAIFDVLLEGPR